MADPIELQGQDRSAVSPLTPTSCYYPGGRRMNELERIRSVLIAMRRRTLLRAALQTAGFGLAAMLVALLALALSAAAVGPAGFWPLLSVVVLAALGVGAFAFGVLRPARHLRGDRAAARLVSRLHPPVASDLVSAVELGQPDEMPAAPDVETVGVSRALVRALQGSVAGAVEPLDPRRLISLRPAVLALGVLRAGGGDHRRGAAPVARSRSAAWRRSRTGRRASKGRRSRRRRWSATCASPTSIRRTPAWPRGWSTARPATSSRSRGPR